MPSWWPGLPFRAALAQLSSLHLRSGLQSTPRPRQTRAWQAWEPLVTYGSLYRALSTAGGVPPDPPEFQQRISRENTYPLTGATAPAPDPMRPRDFPREHPEVPQTTFPMSSLRPSYWQIPTRWPFLGPGYTWVALKALRPTRGKGRAFTQKDPSPERKLLFL